ncbi:MAG TPA: chloride channel protein [Thalassospira lucentensis]|uniref:Chloride channel protein n=2 Tax=Thalassospira lucentensis TaxID=168935 RepID=A0A358HNC2_9PROT|nr:chloride channel protein [Thalassospira lucentensis]HCW67596.1 chloride channel protein [Thalassospira lucentensis]
MVEPSIDAASSRRASMLSLCMLALVVGVVTGYGAVVFRALVALIHNVAFYGVFSINYDANLLTAPSTWGPLVILVPVIGGLFVVFLVNTFAPEAKGHGVPEVMNAIYFEQGRIRPMVALVKSVASSLSIGTGASVGREGPIIQIGSSLGSSIAQMFNLQTGQRITLLAAGAGAGIAATFNTPLGAVLFAIELMMPEVSTRTFLPVVIATGAATYIGRISFGLAPAFEVPLAAVPQVSAVDLQALIVYVVLGVLCGIAAWALIRSMLVTSTLFKKMPGNDYTRHAVGMLSIGILMYVLLLTGGNYYVDGVGYGVIQEILRGTMTSLPLLVILFFAKLYATSVSIGSGASGGVFSPSLFVGATLGAAVGVVGNMIFPDAGITPVEFALVGMGGVVAAGTGAAMTAIIMIFEMTRDYNIIVPLVVAVAIALGFRRMIISETIYTSKLVLRGRHIPKERHSNMFMVHPVREIMTSDQIYIDASLRVSEVIEKIGPSPVAKPLVVMEGGRIAGVIPDVTALYAVAGDQGHKALKEVIKEDFVVVVDDMNMYDVIKRMERRKARAAVVVRPCRGVPRQDDIRGVITKSHIADSVVSSMQHYIG